MLEAFLSKNMKNIITKFSRSKCGSYSLFRMEDDLGSYIEISLSLDDLKYKFKDKRTKKSGTGSLGPVIESWNGSIIFHKISEIFGEDQNEV